MGYAWRIIVIAAMLCTAVPGRAQSDAAGEGLHTSVLYQRTAHSILLRLNFAQFGGLSGHGGLGSIGPDAIRKRRTRMHYLGQPLIDRFYADEALAYDPRQPSACKPSWPRIEVITAPVIRFLNLNCPPLRNADARLLADVEALLIRAGVRP
ncbi:MAG: hypothetical protein ABR584_05335 [Candidatus Baltobacteraceae bacterium]